MPWQRDVLGESETLAPRVAFKEQSPPSAHRLDGWPPDIAASVAPSPLPDPDLFVGRSPELHFPASPVEVPHTMLMYSTREVQRAREREETTAPRSLN